MQEKYFFEAEIYFSRKALRGSVVNGEKNKNMFKMVIVFSKACQHFGVYCKIKCS